jgi:hypothetical protein
VRGLAPDGCRDEVRQAAVGTRRGASGGEEVRSRKEAQRSEGGGAAGEAGGVTVGGRRRDSWRAATRPERLAARPERPTARENPICLSCWVRLGRRMGEIENEVGMWGIL